MDNGWFKHHRKMRDWCWRKFPHHYSVFCFMLENCAYEDYKEGRFVIKKGQISTSENTISQETGIHRKTVKKVIADLTETGEIKLICDKYRQYYKLYEICRYSDYQSSDVHADVQKCTTKSQLNSTNIEIKEIYNNIPPPPPCACVRETSEFLNEALKSQVWVEQVCMSNRITVQALEQYVSDFITDMQMRGNTMSTDEKDAKSHFLNWLSIRRRIEKQNNNGNQSTENPTERINRLLRGDIRN